MPRYFFHVFQEGEDNVIDADGVELANDDAAWAEAASASGQMIRDIDGSMRPNTIWCMEVADGSGAKLFRLTFSAERMRRPTAR